MVLYKTFIAQIYSTEHLYVVYSMPKKLKGAEWKLLECENIRVLCYNNYENRGGFFYINDSFDS